MQVVNNMTDEKFILRDRTLTREIAQILNALKDNGLTEVERQQLRDQLRLCLEQLTALMGLGSSAGN